MFRFLMFLIIAGGIALLVTRPGADRANELYVARVQERLSAPLVGSDTPASLQALAGVCRLLPAQCAEGITQLYRMDYTNHYLLGVLDVTERTGGAASTCIAIATRLICHDSGG